MCTNVSIYSKYLDIPLNNEKRLIDDLFKNYQVKHGRPVNNMSESVVVYFELYLIQLKDLVNLIITFNYIKRLNSRPYFFFMHVLHTYRK